MVDLTQVLTFSEAAEKWGFANGNTLRKAAERKKFNSDEIRKSGDVWLTTYQAMYRVFGEPRYLDQVVSHEKISRLISESVYSHENMKAEFEEIYHKLLCSIEKNGVVKVVASENQPEHILSVMKTKEDLDMFWKPLQRYMQSLIKYQDEDDK